MKAPVKLKTVKALEQAIAAQKKLRQADKKPVLTVSAGTCGQARGALKVVEALQGALKKAKLDKKVKVRVTGCHGFCEAEPNILVHPHDLFYQKVDPKNAEAIVLETVKKNKTIKALLYKDPVTGKTAPREKAIPFYKKQRRIVLGDNALIDPTQIDDYLAVGGYGALAKVLGKMTAEGVIAEV
jgi:NADH-quinone oxidoreductase subunit F